MVISMNNFQLHLDFPDPVISLIGLSDPPNFGGFSRLKSAIRLLFWGTLGLMTRFPLLP
jgi:hypothetical protein